MPVFLFRESQCGGELGQLLILLSRYMAPSNTLPPSNRVTRSLRQTTQETPLPAQQAPSPD